MAERTDIQAIIFDFDGLILETEAPVYRSWCEVYGRFGLELPFSEWGKIIGTANAEHFNPLSQLERLIGRELNHDEILRQRRERELAMIHAQPVMPGVLACLQDAKAMGLKLGVASSSSRDWVTGHLERLGLLDFFECIRTSDDVERTKPDPALYQLVLQALHVTPQEAIVFEDSPNGITAAKRAGLFCVAVPNEITRLLPIEHADMVLGSLADIRLPDLLRQVVAKRQGDML